MTIEQSSDNNPFKSSFDFYEIMHQSFDAINPITGTYSSNQALKSQDAIENLKLQIDEQDKNREQVTGYVETLTSMQELREERERERIRSMQDDYSQTFTNDELDQMEWRGNSDMIWAIGGIQISRKNAFGAGKKARDNWNNSAAARNMSPEDRAKIDQQFSQYMQAIKNGDYNLARQIYGQMPPEARADIDEANKIGNGNGQSLNLQNNSDKAVDLETVVTNCMAVYESAPTQSCISSNLNMGSACEAVIAAEHRPTPAFNTSANPTAIVNDVALAPANNNAIIVASNNSKIQAPTLETF